MTSTAPSTGKEAGWQKRGRSALALTLALTLARTLALTLALTLARTLARTLALALALASGVRLASGLGAECTGPAHPLGRRERSLTPLDDLGLA